MLIVDRITEGFAVCEQPDKTTIHIPLTQLPAEIKEGDCLQKTEDAYTIDTEQTTLRRQQNQALFRSLLAED